MYMSWVSLVAQMVKNLPVIRRLRFDPWVGMIRWRREWLPTPVFLPGHSKDRGARWVTVPEISESGMTQ